MKILGIETSCDETAAAVIEQLPDKSLKILSNVVASSADMHSKTGGVIPESAAREQVKSIIPVIDEALKKAKLTSGDLDAIAVTVGPGLIGSLLVGVETARTLALLWNKPIIPINHLIGHIYANWVGSSPQFPLLALVVSGGHTDLVYMKNHNDIKYVGGTLDDAAGEAFDKTARLLGLSYPGGPNLSKAAQKYLDQSPSVKLNLFPRPMLNNKNFDWSFSGLKTAVSRELLKHEKISESEKEYFSAEVQEAIVDCLVEKSLRAIEKYKPRSFLLAGGVAANSRLREKLKAGTPMRHSGKLTRTSLHVPDVTLCTDNAAYIAAAAFFVGKKVPWQKVNANPELTIKDLV